MAKRQTKVKVKAKKKPVAKARAKAKAKTKRIVARVKSKVTHAAKAVTKTVKAKTSQLKSAVSQAAAPLLHKAKAPGYQWINAFLTVRDCSQAIAFYQTVFGFELRMSMPGPDGKIVHAEMLHNGSVLMMGPANQQMGAPEGQSPVILYTYVENVDEVASRAGSAGATIVQQPRDEFWGDRCCILVDPQGHSWMLATHVKDISPEEMHMP
ncbi:glyoxalase/bleomycin resistance/extradiol dioxygenase family protein [bacterium]|nr:glyoxalase/bleomycin resistance/extradiol dioxygenase family protein [bacterium]MCI0603789.1 glyoxalase/bleomycin resistance/extradiol dioxygenase family protein [bacterium]